MTSPFDEKDYAINEGTLPEPPPFFPPWVNKVFLIGGAVLMLLLLLSYLLPSNVSHVLAERIGTNDQDERVLFLKSGEEIIFEGGVYDELLELYFAEQQHEFAVCLQGTLSHHQYFIESLHLPRTISQSFSHVHSEPCPSETLVFLHTHPYSNCFLSEQDVSAFSHVLERNPQTLMAVMCQEDRFMVMNQAQFLEYVSNEVR